MTQKVEKNKNQSKKSDPAIHEGFAEFMDNLSKENESDLKDFEKNRKKTLKTTPQKKS